MAETPKPGAGAAAGAAAGADIQTDGVKRFIELFHLLTGSGGGAAAPQSAQANAARAQALPQPQWGGVNADPMNPGYATGYDRSGQPTDANGYYMTQETGGPVGLLQGLTANFEGDHSAPYNMLDRLLNGERAHPKGMAMTRAQDSGDEAKGNNNAKGIRTKGAGGPQIK